MTLKPAMSSAEIALFERQIEGAGAYLEFGAGGSTGTVAAYGIARIWSVESDLRFIETLRTENDIALAESRGQLHFHHGDIGPTERLGYPHGYLDSRKRFGRSWPNYYTSIWPCLDARELDVILVDGRFRVASTLAVLTQCRPDVRILIHDFWNRSVYHALLRYLDVVDRADTLGVFTPKPHLDRLHLKFDQVRFAYQAH